jgi:hypothetical protein
MADAEYTDGDAVDGDTVAVIGDRIKILTLGLVKLVLNADGATTTTLYATAELEFDNHPLGALDSLTISGIALAWNAGTARFEGTSASSAVVTIFDYNFFTAGSEAGFGITAGNMNGKSVSLYFEKLHFHTWGCTDADKLVGRNKPARIWVQVHFDLNNTVFTGAMGTVTITDTVTPTAATWSGVAGYWYADFTYNLIVLRTFSISAFTDTKSGITTNTVAAGPDVQWTDISVGSIAVSGTSGTYQTQLNVTVTWAHNASAVNNGKFYVYNATNQITNKNSTATGLVQFTLVGTLHGASTLTVNGSRWLAGEYINTYADTILAYSVTASGLAATVPGSATVSDTISVPYQFTNAAVLSGTSLKAENVRVRFRILQGATVLLESNTTLFDVNAAATYSSTKSITITGVSVTGSYTFRVTVFHIGSDWQLATQDYAIYLMVGGSSLGGGIDGVTKPPFLLSVADLRNSALAGQQLTGLIHVTFTGIPSLQIARAETNASWLTFPTLPNGTLVSPIDLSWLANIPYDLPAGQYVIRVTVTGKDNALEGTSFGYITLDVTSTAPVQEWTYNLGLGIVLAAVVVLIIRSGKSRKRVIQTRRRVYVPSARRKRGR